MKKCRKILLALLSMLMLAFSLAPTTAFAEGGEVATPTETEQISEPLIQPMLLTAEVIAADVTLIVKDSISKITLEKGEFTLFDPSGSAVKMSKQGSGEWRVDAAGADTLVSDKDGKIVLTGLAPDTYTVKQTKALSGYAPPEKTWKFTASETGVSGDSELLNEPLTLELAFSDSLSGALVGGMEVTIIRNSAAVKAIKQSNGEWYADDGGVDNFVTNASGAIVLRYISAGDYAISQTKAVDGYALMPATTLSVTSGNGSTKPAKAAVKLISTKLVFQKLNGMTNTPVSVPASGTTAAFQLLDKDGKAIKLKKDGDVYKPDANGQDAFTCNASGKAEFLHLPHDSYTIAEITPVTGYAKTANISFELKNEHTAIAPLTVQSKSNPSMFIIYNVKADGTLLAGAGFEITAKGSTQPLLFNLKDGIYYLDAAGSTKTVQVDERGEARIYYLPAGEYTLTQTITPKEYFGVTPQTFSVAGDSDLNKPASLCVTNDTSVQLGFDDDWYRIPLAVVLVLLALGAGPFALFALYKKRQRA